jgi:hypothetical protein
LAVSFRKKRERLKDFFFFFFKNGAKFPPKQRIVSGISLSVFFFGWQNLATWGIFFENEKKENFVI